MALESLQHTLIFKVTHRCNLGCSYCYAVDETSPMADIHLVRDVMEASARLDADVVHVIWHGGEPLLLGKQFYAEAIELQRWVADRSGKRFSNSIQTNGTLVTEEMATFLSEEAFAVGVSIDGPASVHDLHRQTVRGSPTYEQALRGFRRLQAAGANPGLVCVIDPVRPPPIPEFVAWLSQIDARSVSLNSIFSQRTAPAGRWPEFLLGLQTEIERQRLFIQVRELVFAGTTPEQRERQGLVDACHPGWPCHETITTVNERGEIFFACDRFLDKDLTEPGQFRVGSIYDGGFPSAFRSERYARFAEAGSRSRQQCAPCSHNSSCDGGCMADWMLLDQSAVASRPDIVHCHGVAALAGAPVSITRKPT